MTPHDDRDAAPFDPDAAPLDPADSLAIIRAQRAVVRDSAAVDGRVLFGAWGVAWLVGYGALYASAVGRPSEGPGAWGFVVFAACLAAAIVVTTVHIAHRTAGVRGVSAVTGAMYGWTWFWGYLVMSVLLGALGTAGASAEVMAIAANGMACLVAGLLYMAGGALWRDRVLYVVGAWILTCGVTATFAGIPTTYLVMAVAGGGAFLAGAVVVHVHRRRAPTGLDRPVRR
jgi:hypothetical protein